MSDGDRADAKAYADVTEVTLVRNRPEAEAFLKAPDTSLASWDREEALRKALLARAEAQHPGRALWTSLTELTTETGDSVHGKAATAAARAGNVTAAAIHVAAGAAIHVAAGAAAQAVYQLAVARLAGETASLFESKFRLYAAGRWPLGILGTRLVLF